MSLIIYCVCIVLDVDGDNVDYIDNNYNDDVDDVDKVNFNDDDNVENNDNFSCV